MISSESSSNWGRFSGSFSVASSVRFSCSNCSKIGTGFEGFEGWEYWGFIDLI